MLQRRILIFEGPTKRERGSQTKTNSCKANGAIAIAEMGNVVGGSRQRMIREWETRDAAVFFERACTGAKGVGGDRHKGQFASNLRNGKSS